MFVHFMADWHDLQFSAADASSDMPSKTSCWTGNLSARLQHKTLPAENRTLMISYSSRPPTLLRRDTRRDINFHLTCREGSHKTKALKGLVRHTVKGSRIEVTSIELNEK